MLKHFFENIILEHARIVFVIILATIGFLVYPATNLKIDASTETLIMENDEDLRITREIANRYKSPDFLVVTYTPKDGDLLSDKTLDGIRRIKADLLKLDRIESVTSIIDVPLLESPPRPIKEMIKNVSTLESPGIDMTLAKKELLNSPIYRDNLVSPDFKTTALLANLHDDDLLLSFIDRRRTLRQKEMDGTITPQEKINLGKTIADLKTHRDKMRDVEHENIARVRAIMGKYRDEADIFLGGVTMISDDLVTFIKDDLKFFGLGVLLFLIVILWVIFRQLRWLTLPVLTCLFSVVTTCGILGMFGWEVTVISSNFISIQLIITMAITIHLIVRYRELAIANPEADQRQLVLDTVLSMAKPCLYAILTTMAGFSSLIFCEMLPVINFGWMMTAGIGLSLILTFLIFPTVMMMMKKTRPNISFESRFALTKGMANLTENHGAKILWLSALVAVLSVAGASRLMVENSFIDYFKESTEIYQGMKVIDQQLGGTTPLDVVLNFDEDEEEVPPPALTTLSDEEEDEEFDDFENEFEADKGKAQYWFTAEKMARVEKIHDYLDNIPETGKVMSLGNMLKVGKTLNNGKPLDNFLLALVYNELPDKIKDIILSPYVSVEDNQVRFSIRVRDSQPDLRRNELLKKIRHDLKEDLQLNEDSFQLTNLLVLYNNMLQSLFSSQILTLGAVMTALMIMFIILFRSVKIALIAIFPNLLSVGAVLGFMGWARIPLDMMTITIAAISVGIAVDNTIHYIHRFKKEFARDGNYLASMHRCHGSIGYAMYYTSVTIIIGFSILVLSNFIPSIYFGLLTGLAMAIALVAALTLLPQLIIFIKPLGPENE
jgi:predicted RND superfamily exporter protein